jgi:hypothetical protein
VLNEDDGLSESDLSDARLDDERALVSVRLILDGRNECDRREERDGADVGPERECV